MFRFGIAAFSVVLAISTPAFAQQPAPSDPAALAAARDVVSRMQGDRAAVLQAMSAPLSALILQMGVKEADRAQILTNEVIVPTLAAHLDELLDIQARAYAATLPVADLQAAATFYGSPAGRNFAAAQPKLAQAQLTGMTQWMGRIAPEIQTKLTEVIANRGWGAAGRK